MAESARNVALANVQVVRRRNELVLRLPEGIVFASGDASVKESAMRTLLALAATLRPCRWTSASRATPTTARSTTRFPLQLGPLHRARHERARAPDRGRARCPRAPLRRGLATGSSPVASNDTDANRQLNRRVDLVVSAQPPPTDAGESAEQPVDATGPRPPTRTTRPDAQAPATDTQAFRNRRTGARGPTLPRSPPSTTPTSLLLLTSLRTSPPRTTPTTRTRQRTDNPSAP